MPRRVSDISTSAEDLPLLVRPFQCEECGTISNGETLLGAVRLPAGWWQIETYHPENDALDRYACSDTCAYEFRLRPILAHEKFMRDIEEAETAKKTSDRAEIDRLLAPLMQRK